MNHDAILTGCSVLLVEDESLVSMMAEDALLDAGCEVLLAMRLQEGLAVCATANIDFAILDVNLGGGILSYPIAAELQRRGIPFLFATGYAATELAADYALSPVIEKPYTPRELLDAAHGLLTGTAAVPTPR
ncbi:response regulator [Halopseudomonas nanhaiensis]|uniref:response regulator n=1 Tax=Halopseudomonas nanhaiensis TaxID=2830842 RepID=UPI001CC04DD9|nr:response regulator [Halopseudomonas nanhaiensis]UAW97554.1 response regulator [Halopseudomonas nanhaiensis]